MQRLDKLWAAVVIMIALDFVSTFYAITSGKAVENNPMVAPLWAARDYPKILLYTFIISPFSLYGIWTFFGRKKHLLYLNLAVYSIVLLNNGLVIAMA